MTSPYRYTHAEAVSILLTDFEENEKASEVLKHLAEAGRTWGKDRDEAIIYLKTALNDLFNAEEAKDDAELIESRRTDAAIEREEARREYYEDR